MLAFVPDCYSSKLSMSTSNGSSSVATTVDLQRLAQQDQAVVTPVQSGREPPPRRAPSPCDTVSPNDMQLYLDQYPPSLVAQLRLQRTHNYLDQQMQLLVINLLTSLMPFLVAVTQFLNMVTLIACLVGHALRLSGEAHQLPHASVAPTLPLEAESELDEVDMVPATQPYPDVSTTQPIAPPNYEAIGLDDPSTPPLLGDWPVLIMDSQEHGCHDDVQAPHHDSPTKKSRH
ncbi:hypothetical protein V8C86DRAFT_2438338 [Haematococcus lacustris]